MRLIDADALKTWVDCGHLRPPMELCFSELDVVRMLDKQPTIDAEPVRHGQWIPMYEEAERLTTEGWQIGEVQTAWKCSLCGREEIADRDEMPYCHCGAKMRGENECSDG